MKSEERLGTAAFGAGLKSIRGQEKASVNALLLLF